MLMDLNTLSWDAEIAADMGIPMSMLPAIKSSSEIYGYGREEGLLGGVPIAGDLGDQQAATFGQAAFNVGDAKNTYGTGCFMIMNTGEEIVPSRTACSRPSATRSATPSRSTLSRARSPSPAPWCSGCVTT